MVLSAFAGDGAVVDGVDRAVMVTGETTGTTAVMEPLGRSALNIIDRTDLRTLATLNAEIGIDHELLIRNHPFVEITSDDIGIESWRGTFLQRYDTLPAIFNGSDDF